MQLTVAICTYNPSRDNLTRALDAVVDQLADVSPAEILVVDNNSSPPLAECQYLLGYPLRLIREPKPGLTAAREAVARNAEGDVIVFVDDDNILGEHYLAKAVEAFAADPQLGLLGGSVVPEYAIDPPKWFDEFAPWLAIRPYPPESHIETIELPLTEPTKCFPVGAGFATRRELAIAYQADCARTARIEGRRGGALSSGEDLDLGLFVLSQGSKLLITGALRLTHVIPPGRIRSGYLKRLAVGKVKSTQELDRKWSPRFGRPVYPIFYMPMASILARAVAAALLGLYSPRYRIKRCIYTALIRARLRTATRPTRGFGPR
jgi:glycosyltransferase involved in cell wall biosynthesis